MIRTRSAWVVAAIVAALVGIGYSSAEDPKQPDPGQAAVPGADKEQQDLMKFWFDARRAQAAAAAELVLEQNPFTVLALRMRGQDFIVWNEPEVAADEAPPLSPEWLASLGERDRKPAPDLRGKAPDEITRGERDFYNIYNQALSNAWWVPEAAFAKSAKDTGYVTFAHLYNEPWKYRGKVIHFEGHLKRLRPWDAPSAVQANGIKIIYEGWIALTTYKTHPLCVIFPNLPKGLKPAEIMNQWVEFDGYFISLYRYKSGKGELDTPLLIGPTVKLTQAPPVQHNALISPSLLYGFVGFVCLVIVLIVFLSLWYKRGDQAVRAKLAQLQTERTLEMLDHPAEPEPLDKPREGNGYLHDH